MTKRFFTTTGVDLSGTTWAAPAGLADLPGIAAVTLPGDAIFFSHKPTDPFWFDTTTATGQGSAFPDSMSGEVGNYTNVECGQYGTQNGVSHMHYRKSWMLGDSPYPWTFGDSEGTFGRFSVSASYINFKGFNIAHQKRGATISSPSTYVALYDHTVFNCHEGIYAANVEGFVKVVNYRARDIRKTGLRFGADVDNVLIDDAKIDMGAIEGAPFANGVQLDDTDNLVCKHLYVSNSIYMMNSNGDIQDSYVQGDGVTVNAGFNHRFYDSHTIRCGDRGFDTKASDARFVGCSANMTKFGFGFWANHPDNLMLGCVVKNTAAVRDEGACIQVIGGFLKVIGCHLTCTDLVDPADNSDRGAVLRLITGNSGSGPIADVLMIGGSITTTEGVAVVRFDHVGCKMTFVNVRINGELFTGTRTYDGTGNWWIPVAPQVNLI